MHWAYRRVLRLHSLHYRSGPWLLDERMDVSFVCHPRNPPGHSCPARRVTMLALAGVGRSRLNRWPPLGPLCPFFPRLPFGTPRSSPVPPRLGACPSAVRFLLPPAPALAVAGWLFPLLAVAHLPPRRHLPARCALPSSRPFLVRGMLGDPPPVCLRSARAPSPRRIWRILLFTAGLVRGYPLGRRDPAPPFSLHRYTLSTRLAYLLLVCLGSRTT